VRILLTLQYLGTRYAGWQRQANAVGVQQVMEDALAKMFGAAARIEGAGRTDSGVHAAAQRAHFDAPIEIAPRGMVLGLNDLLPSDIRVLRAQVVADDFHCRFAALGKVYEYRIWNAEVADVFSAETHAHVAQPLDEKLMEAAAQPLVGEHDFRAFTVASPEVSSTKRTVHSVRVRRSEQTVSVEVTANGFLRYMVRRIAGSLIEIGRGKLDRQAIAEALEPMFKEARWTAPAKGLTLMVIRY
jgi:tRNA pseudouridine38-40 synthase